MERGGEVEGMNEWYRGWGGDSFGKEVSKKIRAE